MASILAGVLLFLGHLTSFDGDPTYGTVLGSSLVLAAHTLLIFTHVALYASHADYAPVLSGLAIVLGVIGTTLNCAAIFGDCRRGPGRRPTAYHPAGRDCC